MVKRLPPDELDASLRALPRALRAAGRAPAWASVWARVRAPRSAWDFPLTRASASLAMLTLLLMTLWPAGMGNLSLPNAARIGVAPAPIGPAQTQVIPGEATFKLLASPATIGAEAAATPPPFTTPGPRH